jgi:transcriptional regulator with XRE-family HTH domain
MTNRTHKIVRLADDLPREHWISRQLPPGTSLRPFAEDEAISALTSAVQDALDDAGVSRSEAAELLGTTRSYVSQVLNGSTNMTLRTLGALLWASGRQVTGLRTERLGAEARVDKPKAVFTDRAVTTTVQKEQPYLVDAIREDHVLRATFLTSNCLG